MSSLPRRSSTVIISLLLFISGIADSQASNRITKQQSLDEWRSLTSSNALPPRVLVKGDQVRFYFHNQGGIEVFNSHWTRLRVPIGRYRVNSALLHWNQRLSRMPPPERGWRGATVIAGAEWRQLTTNVISRLTPQSPGHGAYYQAFLADRLLFRDAQGHPRFALLGEQPKDIIVDHQYSMSETLELLARLFDEQFASSHSGDSLFLMMAPDGKRFTEPLLLDRQRRQCVLLAPAALYDSTERGGTLAVTVQGLGALAEGQGLSILKNPVSTAARAGDFAMETLLSLLRLPLPKLRHDVPPLAHNPPMDLAGWDAWLDRYTGTRLQDASLDLLIDGDQYFPRLYQAIAEATDHIHINVYIFDRDDVAVKVADLLKRRSAEVQVEVIMDRMGSIVAGLVPPATPLPEDFDQPPSIVAYLRAGSQVHVHQFLNPWFSSDHSKVLIFDGTRAFVGGMNFGREYRYEWHDLMVELQGPIVHSLESEFHRMWAHEGLFGDLGYTVALLNPPPARAQRAGGAWAKVRLLPTKTAWKPFSQAVVGSIRRAQSFVYAENPYLFDKRVLLALVKARQRGVDVRVILPCINDFKAAGRSNLVIANYLHEHGIRVYFYPAMTHVKALLVDGWAVVGSGNLNNFSIRYNQEQNIATSDPAFAARLKRDLFEADFNRSYEMTQPISVDWVDFLSDLVLEGF